MMLNSRYLISGAPITCAHCKQPFPVLNGHVEAWRSSTGGYFCNEYCAEDEDRKRLFKITEGRRDYPETRLLAAGWCQADSHRPAGHC
jgi:hypothetical protein